MSDFKFWVQGYDEELGEFSIGYNDLSMAWSEYDYKMNKVNEHGGRVEFIEVSQVAFYKKGE